MCCNNAYTVNKNHELLSQPEINLQRIKDKQQRKKPLIINAEDKENAGQIEEEGGYGGDMQISDKQGENEQLVKHIRQTSSIASRSTIFDA